MNDYLKSDIIVSLHLVDPSISVDYNDKDCRLARKMCDGLNRLEAGLLNKSSCLTPTLGVTKFLK
jgi:hypothetical protein